LALAGWPEADGQWVDGHLEGGALYQYGHRVLGGIWGILTLVLVVLLWFKEERRWVRWFAALTLAGMVAQEVVGGEVILQFLHYWLPVWHAMFAQLMFGAILVIAVVTSAWWVSERPQMEDRGTPSIHRLALLNALAIFVQSFLGAGYRHNDMPFWPHTAVALVVLATVVWTAVALRKRFETSRELTKMRILLHSVFGVQFLLGFGAYWARMKNADVTQPTALPVSLTVTHTVVGALFFGVAVMTVLLTYRLVPRGDAVAVSSQRVAV
jgi:heme A synthase